MAYVNPLRTRFAPDFFAALPKEPGVYFMFSKTRKLLYVGKAKSLRARVGSYRHVKPGSVGKNILKLLEKVEIIEWETQPSEREASDREREIIRALVPRYNILDAWEESYFFIGLRARTSDRLEFRMTIQENRAEDFRLHGCFLKRRQAKTGYSALLRLLHACGHREARFGYPARIARESPAYDFKIKVPEAKRWEKLVSDFLHGINDQLLLEIVEGLLANEKIPPYARPALQRDLETLRDFQRGAREFRTRSGLPNSFLGPEEVRLKIRLSLERPEARCIRRK